MVSEQGGKRIEKIFLKGAFFHSGDLWYPIKLFFLAGENGWSGVSKKLEYGDLLLLEDQIGGEEFRSFVNALENTTDMSLMSFPLRLPKGHVVDPNENPHQLQEKGIFINLNDYERRLLTEMRSVPRTLLRELPSRLFMFRFQPDPDCQKAYYEHVFKPVPLRRELPMFPDYHSAIGCFLGEEAGSLGDWTIMFSIPITNALIRTVRYGKSKFVLDVERGGLPEDCLRCKYYVEYDAGSPETGELNLAESKIINVSSDVRRLYLALYDDRVPDSLLDYRDYNWRDPFGAIRELDVEYDEENLEYLLSSGEGKRLEFKLDLGSNKKEFLETVCSFSNSEGGLIFVGVRDNGSVVGFDERKMERLQQSIIDSVRSSIEPQVQLDLKAISYQGKSILVVKVPNGAVPPYNYKDHGIFVRIADRDRLATVDEVVALTKISHASPYQLN